MLNFIKAPPTSIVAGATHAAPIRGEGEAKITAHRSLVGLNVFIVMRRGNASTNPDAVALGVSGIRAEVALAVGVWARLFHVCSI